MYFPDRYQQKSVRAYLEAARISVAVLAGYVRNPCCNDRAIPAHQAMVKLQVSDVQMSRQTS